MQKRRFEEEERKVNVQIQLCYRTPSKHSESFIRHALPNLKGPLVAGVLALTSLRAFAGMPQQGSSQLQPRPIVIPNRTLDPHELNELEQRNAKRRNMDAANTERKRVIEDETNKLLILARDLKAKTDSLGTVILTPAMAREAEVIEILANDVKEKMKLTVSAD